MVKIVARQEPAPEDPPQDPENPAEPEGGEEAGTGTDTDPASA